LEEGSKPQEEEEMTVKKIQQFHESVVKARKELSKGMRSPHSSISQDFPSWEYKIKSIKLAKGQKRGTKGRRLYDITFAEKKRKERKGHPFRGK
jgi:hypothetical protein